MSWIAAARDVYKNHQARRINIETGHLVPNGRHTRGKVVLLDGFTASGLVQVYDKLSEENKKKFDSLSLMKAIDVMWKILKVRRSQ